MNYIFKIVIVIAFIVNACAVTAQSPGIAAEATISKVQAVEVVQLNSSSYKSAAEFWKIQTSINSKNEDAWLNYYKAIRYAEYTDKSRKISDAAEAKLVQILGEMQRNVAGSFAFYYANYLQQNRSVSSFNHLENAFLLRPDDNELWDDMLCKSVIENNNQQIDFFARKLSESNIYSEAELEYNKNVLNSVEQNAILVTHGNTDTYPLIILQQVQNYRRDVKIICLDWFNNSNYLSDLSKSDSKLFGKLTINQPYESIKSITKNAQDKPLYLGLTIPGDVVVELSKDLYCTGLAMKYSKSPLSNMISLEANWNQFFSKKTITQKEAINKNYVLPLVLLNDYYKESGRTSDAASIQKILQSIGANFGIQSSLQKHMD